MSQTTLEGRCNCGAIVVRLPRPERISLCHCISCRRSTGALAAPFLPCIKTEYTLTGSPKLYNEVGDSGKPVERGFCGDCGSSLWYADGIKPHQIYFHGGLFDPQTIPAPTHELFTRNMEVWEKSYAGEGVFSETGQRV